MKQVPHTLKYGSVQIFIHKFGHAGNSTISSRSEKSKKEYDGFITIRISHGEDDYRFKLVVYRNLDS